MGSSSSGYAPKPNGRASTTRNFSTTLDTLPYDRFVEWTSSSLRISFVHAVAAMILNRHVWRRYGLPDTLCTFFGLELGIQHFELF